LLQRLLEICFRCFSFWIFFFDLNFGFDLWQFCVQFVWIVSVSLCRRSDSCRQTHLERC
jgi:hypothetical protein